MKKGIKLVLFGALLVGSLAACEKEEQTNNSNTENNTTETPTERTLNAIVANVDSVKKTYTYGEVLDLTGLVVSATYSDNTVENVTGYTTNPAAGAALNEVGNKDVVVTYQGKTDKFTITVDKALTSITLDTNAVKKEYNYGERFDLTGLVVTANYNDGSKKEVTDYSYAIDENEGFFTLGSHTVTIDYQGKKETFTVTVAKVFTDIEIDVNNVKKDYKHHENLDLTGLVVKAVYSDDSKETVTNYTTDPANGTALDTAGVTRVAVTYEGKVKTFDVLVNKVLESISLDTTNVKKVYNYGEQLDLTGLVVVGNYSDNSTSEISGGYTSNIGHGTKLEFVGGRTITISYNGKTDSFSITVNKEFKNITLDTTNVKKDYHYGEALDLTGIVVKANYSDGSYVDVTSSATFDPAEGAILTGAFGPKTITAEYKGKTASFSVNIQPNTETGTTVTVDLGRALNFGSMTSSANKAIFSASGTPGTLFTVTMGATKNSNKEDSMALVNGKTRFYKGDYIENTTAISGITKITVHGGNGNYRLAVGYRNDSIHNFMIPTSNGGDRIFENVPRANYFMLMGTQDDFPADISSIEIEYYRDAENNTYLGVAKTVDDVTIVDGTYAKTSKTIVVNGGTATVNGDEYTFVGIEYTYENKDYLLYKNHAGGGLLINFAGTSVNVIDVDDRYSQFSGVYTMNIPATSVTLMINGSAAPATSEMNRVNLNIGDTFTVSATCDAVPAETPTISLTSDSVSSSDPFVGTYTVRSTVTVEEIMLYCTQDELKVDPIIITKVGDKYYAHYKDYGVEGYAGSEGDFEATIVNGVITFGNGTLEIALDTQTQYFSFTYDDEDGEGVYFYGQDTAYNFSAENKPVATLVNGTVTTYATGNFCVKAVASNGVEAKYYVHVNAYVNATLSLQALTAEVEVGNFYVIQASVNDDATDKTITYTSADPTIAFVRGNVVTGVAEGETTITVASADDTATIVIKVKAPTVEKVYTFEDENGQEHELVVYEGQEAYLDSFTVFKYYSYNGIGWYAFETDEDIGFAIKVSDSQYYIDFWDYTGEVFTEYGPVYYSKGTTGIFFLDEDTSSGGGFTPIVITVPTTNYTFMDDNGDPHTVAVKEHESIVIDEQFTFTYNPLTSRYIYTENSSVYLTIRESGGTYLGFVDPDQVIFGFTSDIVMFDLENEIQIYEA